LGDRWLDNTTGQPYGANSNVDMLINHDNTLRRYLWGLYIRTLRLSSARPITQWGFLAGARVAACGACRGNILSAMSAQMDRAWQPKYALNKRLRHQGTGTDLFVVLDEREDSINDAGTRQILIPCGMSSIIPPAICNAAGYLVRRWSLRVHRFKDPRTTPVLKPGQLLAA